jgi:ubiquinone/menaquinone biosynthesis C-methylase UbiE
MDHSQQAAKVFDKLASAYQDKFMDLDLYDDTYDLFCSLIPKGPAKIFEIACGPGNITKYILTARPELKIKAIDLAPTMIELAKLNNPSADLEVMDCRKIDSIKERFDAIICGFCLPYLSKKETEKLITDCSSLLEKGGFFYFSAIEGDYENSGIESSSDGKEKCYVYYHEELYLKDSLQLNGFEVPEGYRKQYAKAEGTNSTHIIFIAKKK